MSSEAGLTFRSYKDEHVSFIHSSWANSYYDGTIAKKLLCPEEFHTYHRPIRDRFLNRSNKQIIICSPDDDPWHILGWIAIESIPSATVLQYLYVKDAFKCQGIAKALMSHAIKTTPVIYTHLTDRAAMIISKKQSYFQVFKHVPHLV